MAAAVTLLFMGACGSLDVENPNNPDGTLALASGEDVKNIAISTINSWYLTSTYIEPYLMLMVTSDGHTSNCCFGMRFNNMEPRIPLENSSGGGDRDVTEEPWNNNYGTLSAANDAIRAINAGVQITNGTENDKYKALAMFAQAASLSNLALLFDSAFVVDETFDATEGEPSLQRYTLVSSAAIAKWDALIAQLAGKTDSYATPLVLPSTEFALTSENLRKMANTLAALTLRLTPRTPAELNGKAASFWTQILTYANAGITADLIVQGDFNNWYSYIAGYGSDNTWTRVDYRKLNRMDAAGGGANPLPFRYSGPADIRVPGHPTANDQRLADGAAGKDYRYRAGVIGDPARGIYMQSAYSYDRYIGHARTSPTAWTTPVPYILKAENDLLIAEALVKSGGSKATAAGLVNTTRVTRGGLAALTGSESDAVLLAAIDYERDVELAATNGFELFYARSAPTTTPLSASAAGGRIQTGTVRHLPVPARELETLGKSVYTYGGVGRPDMLVVGGNGEMLRLTRPTRPPRPSDRFFRRH
jgi:hypothetical protein